MGRRRRRPHDQSRRPTWSRQLAGGIRLMTPEGDALVFTNAQYQHAAMQEILRILREAGDFGLEDIEPEPDGSIHFPWYEIRPDAPPLVAPLSRRILAGLTLTPTTLEVETISQRRLDDCHRRLEQLLGDRIRRVSTQAKSMDQALREKRPRAVSQEPDLPPEVIAELEERMLRQWIDEPIPALGGLTPRQAVQTAEGRQRVLELIDYSTRVQEKMPRAPGVFAPDYRKVKKMLGLE